jgi:hypothetical protein
MGKRMIIALAIIAVAAGGSAGYFLLRVPLSGRRHPSWRVVEAPFGPYPFIRPSIWALAPDDVWIFGISLESSGIWRFDGREFSFVVGLPNLPYYLSSYVRSENEIWLGGCDNSGMYLYRWDGEKWTKYVPVGKEENHDVELILGIDMLSHDEGWAVAYFQDYQRPSYSARFAGSCFLHWNGKEWRVVPSPPVPLLSIDMLSPDEGWAVGDNILHWDGREWRVVPSPAGHLFDIDMLSPDEGWAVGDNVILHWNGREWRVVPSPVPRYTLYRCIDMLSPNEGWIITDREILKYG